MGLDLIECLMNYQAEGPHMKAGRDDQEAEGARRKV